MISKILLLLAATYFGAVIAANIGDAWTMFGEGTKVDIYINSNTKRSVGENVEADILENFKQKEQNRDYLSKVTRYRVNCATQKFGLVSAFEYSDNLAKGKRKVVYDDTADVSMRDVGDGKYQTTANFAVSQICKLDSPTIRISGQIPAATEQVVLACKYALQRYQNSSSNEVGAVLEIVFLPTIDVSDLPGLIALQLGKGKVYPAKFTFVNNADRKTYRKNVYISKTPFGELKCVQEP